MTSTTLLIITAIISSIGSYFLVKSDATKLNNDNLEEKVVDHKVGNILVFLTIICVILGFVLFTWKIGVGCIVIWFITSAVTGYFIKP